MEIIEPARVEARPERPTIGIRIVTPFRGMLAVRDRLLAEMTKWIRESEIEPVGYGYLRLHVIDMSGPMDLEVGYFTDATLRGRRPRSARLDACRTLRNAHLQGSLAESKPGADRMGARQRRRVRPGGRAGGRSVRVPLRGVLDRPEARAAQDEASGRARVQGRRAKRRAACGAPRAWPSARPTSVR